VSAPIRQDGDALALDVLVQPRASRARVGPVHGDRLKIAVTAPPVDNAANAAVIDVLAGALGCARGAIEVIAGHASRRKTVRVRGVARARIEELCAR
jgi:uncharacterized protein (TIGR00251 family)